MTFKKALKDKFDKGRVEYSTPWDLKHVDARMEMQEEAPVLADQEAVEEAPQESEQPKEPETRTIIQYVTQPAPAQTHIEINEIKNESQGDINVGTLQTRTEPVTPQVLEPAAAPAPQFIEPAPMTPTQIAQDILKLYNLTGTVQELSNNRIKVTLSTGQEVVQDMVGEWAEKLKLTLNKIK